MSAFTIVPSAILAEVTASSMMAFVVTASTAISLAVTAPAAIFGLGYVPVNDPPAFPLGGSDDGAPVNFEYARSKIFAFVTAAAAIWAVPMAPDAIDGLGYVPESDPPAAPLGGSEAGAPVIFE